MIQAFQLAAIFKGRSPKPLRDAERLRFIRRFPCLGCGKTWHVQAAHTGPHGIGQKAGDETTIPLCDECHPAYDKNPRGFAEQHEWDLTEILAFFNHLYSLKTGKLSGQKTKEKRAA